ncbi:MAG: HYR domain-containing protein [Saprospiraceae bacterium]
MRYTEVPRKGESHLATFGVLLLTMLFGTLSRAGTTSSTLTCPDDYVVQAGVGECEIPVFFDTLLWASSQPLVDTVFFPESGSLFPTGTTQVLLVTADINGNIESCTFNIIVEGYNANNATCLLITEVSLMDSCERTIHSAELLDMSATGCAEDFDVTRLTATGDSLPPIIDAFDVGSSFTAVVTNQFTGSSCSVEVLVPGGTPPAITCPPDLTLYCHIPVDTANTGVPALTGCYQDVGLVYYDESVEPQCPDSVAFQISRFWVSTDPFDKKDTCEQLITGMRFSAALVEFPPNFNGTDTVALFCNDTATWQMTASPEVTGVPTFAGFPAEGPFSCKLAVSHLDFETQLCGASYEIKRVWTAVSLCPPSLTVKDTQIIKIIDPFPPVFTLPDTIYVSTATECADSFYVPPATIISECSPFSTEIITPWDTLNTNGGLTHIIPAPGTYPVYYTLTDDCGHTSSDSSIILIDDGLLVACPPSDTVDCDYFLDTLLIAIQSGQLGPINERLGYPQFYANCDLQTEQIFSPNINTCGIGTVERTITTTNTNPVISCTQIITVEHVSDFEVVFPEDIKLCSTPSGNSGEPQILNISCEEMTFSFQDEVVLSPILHCYTVHRKWTVLNTCIYSGVNNHDDVKVEPRWFADGGDGIVEYTQIIDVNDAAQPVFLEGCEIADILLDPDSCTVIFTLPTPLAEACGDSMLLTVSDSLGLGFGESSELGPGTYEVAYHATDDCGNTSTCTTQFEVRDATAPVAVCAAAVFVNLPAATPPEVTVAAIDFNDGSYDNCSGGLAYSFVADSVESERVFTCADAGINPVELWVRDSSGNQDFCPTTLIVQLPVPDTFCQNLSFLIGGTVHTEDNNGINLAELTLESPAGLNVSTNTDTAGAYQFSLLPAGNAYSLTPFKDSNPMNGVTTFDLVLIQKHILGTTPLGSPYKLIAADVNLSGSVTTFDMVQIQQMILNITTSFPNGNTSWRFVDANYAFPDPADPFSEPFPEHLEIANLDADIPDADFIGIKVGDVNDSANPQN